MKYESKILHPGEDSDADFRNCIENSKWCCNKLKNYDVIILKQYRKEMSQYFSTVLQNFVF